MKIFKLIICSVLAIMVCICICGCTPSYYEDDAAKPIEDKAMKLLDEYVKSFGAESEITSLHMMIGAAEDEGIYTGYYLSNVSEIKGGLFSITDGLMLYKDGYFMTEKQILEFIG